MRTEDLATEVITDLLRSAWISERARAELYRQWGSHEARWLRSAARMEARATIFERVLEVRGRGVDRGLVPGHRRWMEAIVGRLPGDTPLGDLFLARLGEWVEAHTPPFLEDEGEAVIALGRQDRETLEWPGKLPTPPPYEPLESPSAEPPGATRFRFGILGDLHIGSAMGEAMARAAITDLNSSGAELVVQLGDITDRGNKEEFRLASEVLANLTMPVVTMLGNHDVFSFNEERLVGREYYPASFGRDPDGVVLEHRGVRFAVLDSAEVATSPFASFNLVSGSFMEGPGGGIVRGALTPPQHDILAEIARPGGGPAFVFLHHPPQPFTGFPPVLFGLRDEDSGRIHATCDSGNVWGIFAGHTHRNARTATYGTVPATEVATARDYPFGYALVDVSERGYAYRFIQISDESLLRRAYATTGVIQRRYARGSSHERGWRWERT